VYPATHSARNHRIRKASLMRRKFAVTATHSGGLRNIRIIDPQARALGRSVLFCAAGQRDARCCVGRRRFVGSC